MSAAAAAAASSNSSEVKSVERTDHSSTLLRMPPPRHYLLHYTYIADANTKRVPYRPGHLALAMKYQYEGKILLGGFYAEGEPGAVFAFNTTRSDVELFVQEDPYKINGIIASYTIREWICSINNPSSPNFAGVTECKAGDQFPKGLIVYENTPQNEVRLDDLLANKRVLIYGTECVTPSSSQTESTSSISPPESVSASSSTVDVVPPDYSPSSRLPPPPELLPIPDDFPPFLKPLLGTWTWLVRDPSGPQNFWYRQITLQPDYSFEWSEIFHHVQLVRYVGLPTNRWGPIRSDLFRDTWNAVNTGLRDMLSGHRSRRMTAKIAQSKIPHAFMNDITVTVVEKALIYPTYKAIPGCAGTVKKAYSPATLPIFLVRQTPDGCLSLGYDSLIFTRTKELKVKMF